MREVQNLFSSVRGTEIFSILTIPIYQQLPLIRDEMSVQYSYERLPIRIRYRYKRREYLFRSTYVCICTYVLPTALTVK